MFWYPAGPQNLKEVLDFAPEVVEGVQSYSCLNGLGTALSDNLAHGGAGEAVQVVITEL